MAMSPIKRLPNFKQQGLTLIEVLIALAIIAIALTAIIKSTSQDIRGTTYLQDKTIAMWVGQNVINETRTGLLRLSGEEPVMQKTTMLDRDWYWQASAIPTPNHRIKKIRVRVFAHAIKSGDYSSLVSLESYVYTP